MSIIIKSIKIFLTLNFFNRVNQNENTIRNRAPSHAALVKESIIPVNIITAQTLKIQVSKLFFGFNPKFKANANQKVIKAA